MTFKLDLDIVKMIDKAFTSHPTLNRSFWRHSSKAISWLSTEKLNQTQQKQTKYNKT